jgi:hypothetical protein
MQASTGREVASSSSSRRGLQIDEPNREEEETAVNTRRKRKGSPGSGSPRSSAAATVHSSRGSSSSEEIRHGEQIKQSTSNTREVESPRHSAGDVASARPFNSSSARSHRSSSQERNRHIGESSQPAPRSQEHLLSSPPYNNKVCYLLSFCTIDSLLFWCRSVVPDGMMLEANWASNSAPFYWLSLQAYLGSVELSQVPGCHH